MELVLLSVSPQVTTQTSLLSIAAKGGFLMIILLIISILAITIIIERIIKFKKSQKREEEFLLDIYNHVKDQHFDLAIRKCEEMKNIPIANVITKAVDNLNSSFAEIKEIIEAAVKKEIHQFEKNLGTLATFAAIAPLIGFLGTVTGMVKVFMKLGATGGGVDISLLANGIWEALITTIGGLTVGIISILFYNYLVSKVENLAQELEEDTNDFIFSVRRMKDENKKT